MVDYQERPKNISKNAIEFAAACFEMNSISELENILYIDERDCYTWEITPKEWMWAIGAALYAKKNSGCIMDDGRVII